MANRKSGDRKRYPKVALSSMLKKANDIAVVCRRDKVKLVKAGVDWGDVDRLLKLSDECMRLNSEMVVGKRKCMDETRELKAFEKNCRTFRNDTLRNMKASLTLHPAPVPVPGYHKDNSRAKLIQDLCDLYVVIREYAPDLERGGFDVSLGKLACEKMQALSDMCARTAVNRNGPEDLMKARNLLCREIMGLIISICSLARITFRDDDPRAGDYRCSKSFF